MKRNPVTKESYKKLPQPQKPKGVPGNPVHVGRPDKSKERMAAYLGMGGFGMNFGRPSMIGSASTFYNNSYMAGGHSGGLGDVPPYIAMMTELNGGILYYPSTLREKFELYRFFYRFNPFVAAAVNLNTDLPMSRLQLRMPKMKDKKQRKMILNFYQEMMDEMHLFDKLHSMLFENNILGNSIVFVQYSEAKKRWEKMMILPPEEITLANYPMSDTKRIQYRPEILNSILAKYSFPTDSYEQYVEYVKTLSEEDQNILRDVSYEFVKQLREHNGTLTFDSDPYSGEGDDKIGSFAYHFTGKRHDYQDWGVSPLESLFIPLLQQVHYQYTQLSLASRNMTPRNLVTAPGITPTELDDLRDQIDQSMLSPDYAIVTSYDVNWNTIGAENRLIDLSKENETIENELFAGLGMSREILTGEGMYSGNRITVELLNTKYLLERERLQRFVENYLFKPVALQNGFYHDNEDGTREWYYPRLGFTRLTIRDNQEVFDQLFQLYQKGSLSIKYIYELFNLDADDIEDDLKKDMFTPNDPTYNEMLREIYTNVGQHIANDTDLVKQVATSLTGPSGHELKYYGEHNEEDGSEDFFKNPLGNPNVPKEIKNNEEGEDNQEESAMEIPEDNQEAEETDGESVQPSDENAEDMPEESNPSAEENAENVRNYLENAIENVRKEKKENASAEESQENLDKKAQEYLKSIVGIEDGQDSAAVAYIEKILRQSEENGKTKKLLDDFFGDEGDENDEWSPEMQSAGLPVKEK